MGNKIKRVIGGQKDILTVVGKAKNVAESTKRKLMGTPDTKDLRTNSTLSRTARQKNLPRRGGQQARKCLKG